MEHSEFESVAYSADVHVYGPAVRFCEFAIRVEGVFPDLISNLRDAGVDEDAVYSAEFLGSLCESVSLGGPG